MEHTKITCPNCSGLDACTKYCPIRVGENIVNFVNSIDCVETHIGEFRKGSDYGVDTAMMVSGYMLEKGSSPIDLITSISANGVVLQGKFKDYLGMTPAQLLKEYSKYNNLSKPVQNKASESLNKFNSNRIIPTPFKPGADVEVVYITFDGKSKKVTTNANLIKWMLNRQSGELEGLIIADAGKTEDGSPYVKVKLSDYGNTWFLPNIERNLKTSEITREAIKMTNVGLILPIEVTHGATTIAVDSQHMYLNKSGIDYIIGTWSATGMVENKEFTDVLSKDKAYKRMLSYMKFIEKHRRFIIPYGLIEPNHIDI